MTTDKRKAQLRKGAQTSRDKKRKKGLEPMEIWVKPEHKPLVKAYLKTLLCLALLILPGCTNHLYEVNKRINSYQYSFNGKSGTKTPEQLKAEGGSCVDFARAKQAELGGEIVILPQVFEQNGQIVTHAVLKVDGWLLDSRFNEIRLAALEKTYPYEVNNGR